MGVSMFEREKLEGRVETGPTAAIAGAGLLALVLVHGWWTGGLEPIWVLLGLAYLGLLAGLALAARREDLPTRILGALVLLLAAAALFESIRRPLRFDLLAWVAVLLTLRAFVAARRLEEAQGRSGS